MLIIIVIILKRLIKVEKGGIKHWKESEIDRGRERHTHTHTHRKRHEG